MNYSHPLPVEVIAERLGVTEWQVRDAIRDLNIEPIRNGYIAPRYTTADMERIRTALEDGHDPEAWQRCGPGWQRRHHIPEGDSNA